MMSFCFQQPVFVAKHLTLLPKAERPPDALEFRHLVSTFQSRLRANGPNSTLQPGGCVAAVCTVTVAAVERHAAMFHGKHQLGKD